MGPLRKDCLGLGLDAPFFRKTGYRKMNESPATAFNLEAYLHLYVYQLEIVLRNKEESKAFPQDT